MDFNEEDFSELPTQEYVFYLGDRNLGSFLMLAEGDVSSEPIERRLLTAPSKTCVGGELTLLWTEDCTEGGPVRIWRAEHPLEIREAERLFNVSHGLEPGQDHAAQADFVPQLRTPEEQRLLQALRADFENPNALLAYAEWLSAQEREDQQAQGEFVLLSQQIDQTDDTDPSYQELQDRWEALLEAHGDIWYAGLSRLNLYPYERSFWINHGCINTVEINRPAVLTERAEELFDAVPLLTSLSFDCEEFDVAELADIPQLEQITRLELCFLDVQPDSLATLLKSPYLKNLRELDLGYNDTGRELIPVLVECPIFSQLTELNLQSCKINSQCLQLIANGIDGDSSQPLALRTLNLNSNSIAPRGIRLLGASATLSNLKSLSLESMKLNSSGIGGLIHAPWVPHLESLSLSSSNLNAKIVESLAQWPTSRLKKLTLSYCRIPDQGLIPLLRSPLFSIVEELELNNNKLTDEAVIELSRSSNLSGLKSLELNCNPFSSAGVIALTQSPYLKQLHTLKLDAIDLTEEAIQAILTTTNLPKLQWLWIGGENKVTDEQRQRLVDRYGDYSGRT